MNTPGFIPDNLKAARLLLGLGQQELGALCGMNQKDISLHENKTTKTLIPVRYMLALHQKGIDLNTLFREGPVRMRTGTGTSLSMVAEPLPAYQRLKASQNAKHTVERSQAIPRKMQAQMAAMLARLEALEAERERDGQ